MPDGERHIVDARRPALFFRLDDVDAPTSALRVAVELFARRRVPLHCAVVPGRLEAETVHFLRDVHAVFPGLEIGQHGWRHVDHAGGGEFGGARDAASQESDIARGREALASAFPGLWRPVFTPPWGKWNAATARALARAGFHVLSAGFPDSRRQRWLGPLAKALGRATVGGVPISYHPGFVPGAPALREISVSVDFAATAGDAARRATSLAEAVRRARARTDRIGVLLHPVDFMNPEAVAGISCFLEEGDGLPPATGLWDLAAREGFLENAF